MADEYKCPTLQDLILSILSEQPKDLERILTKQIRALPEELTLRLLHFILAKGQLDHQTAKIFLRSRHETVVSWIQQKVDLFAYVGRPDAKSKQKRTKKKKFSTIAPMTVPQQIGIREPVADLKDLVISNEVGSSNCHPRFLSSDEIFSSEGCIRSDCDSQILISLPFLNKVSLKSISIDADLADLLADLSLNDNKQTQEQQQEDSSSQMSVPRTIHLFKDRIHLDFDEAEEVTPDQTLVLKEKDLDGKTRIKLKASRFASVSCLTLFIVDNQHGCDVTAFRQMALYGTPVGGYSTVAKTLDKTVKYRDGPCHGGFPCIGPDRGRG